MSAKSLHFGPSTSGATVRQKKTGEPVRFELTEQTRQAVDEYIRHAGKKLGDFLFTGRGRASRCMTTRQYARLVVKWIANIGLDPHFFATHSLRRTKATLICRRTGNLRAVQLLLGHRKIESTVRYLGIEADDALAIAAQVTSGSSTGKADVLCPVPMVSVVPQADMRETHSYSVIALRRETGCSLAS